MNDEIKNKLISYLNTLEKATANAVDLGKQEIPLYVQEIIKWEIVSGIAYGLVWLIVFIFGVYCVYLWVKNKIYNEEWAPLILFTLLPLFGVVPAICNFMDAAKAYYAPRVVIIEKLKRITK